MTFVDIMSLFWLWQLTLTFGLLCVRDRQRHRSQENNFNSKAKLLKTPLSRYNLWCEAIKVVHAAAMGIKIIDVIATILLNLLHCAYTGKLFSSLALSRQLFNWINSSRTWYQRALFFLTDHILSCNVTQLGACPGDYQVCNETSQQCYCLDGYYRSGDFCYDKATLSDSSEHDVTAVVVSIFTIALVVTGLVLVIRKYNLIDYVRHRINLRRSNDVMYEDVMIGQDDPPLVP